MISMIGGLVTSGGPLSGRMRPPFGMIIPEGEQIHREEPFGRVQVKRETDKKKPEKVVPPLFFKRAEESLTD